MADGALVDRWYSATELAGLPGLPGTERNVRARADREGWASRPRSGRGGGSEYTESALPQITQEFLRRRVAVAAANAVKSSPEFQSGQSIGRRLALAEKIDDAARWRQRQR